MDFQSSDEKDEEMPRSSSRTSIVPQSVPTVFKWENGGSIVYLSGSFNDWNSRIPMHGRYQHLIICIVTCERIHYNWFAINSINLIVALVNLLPLLNYQKVIMNTSFLLMATGCMIPMQ